MRAQGVLGEVLRSADDNYLRSEFKSSLEKYLSGDLPFSHNISNKYENVGKLFRAKYAKTLPKTFSVEPENEHHHHHIVHTTHHHSMVETKKNVKHSKIAENPVSCLALLSYFPLLECVLDIPGVDKERLIKRVLHMLLGLLDSIPPNGLNVQPSDCLERYQEFLLRILASENPYFLDSGISLSKPSYLFTEELLSDPSSRIFV